MRDEAGKIILEKWNKARNDLDKKTVYDLIGKGSKGFIFKETSFDNLCQIFRFQYKEEKVNDNGNLSKMKEDKREEFFNLFKRTKVNEIRNKIIHKQAYRPSLDEIERFDNLISAVYWIGQYLDIKDSIN